MKVAQAATMSNQPHRSLAGGTTLIGEELTMTDITITNARGTVSAAEQQSMVQEIAKGRPDTSHDPQSSLSILLLSLACVHAAEALRALTLLPGICCGDSSVTPARHLVVPSICWCGLPMLGQSSARACTFFVKHTGLLQPSEAFYSPSNPPALLVKHLTMT